MVTKPVHACLLIALLAPASPAGELDYYVSVPLIGALQKIDATTYQATPFLTGLNTPFYGFHDQNGDLYIPDHLFGAILRIDPQGNPNLVTSGGLLTSPLALIADPAVPGGMIATDLYQHTVVRVDPAGNQTLIHDDITSGGLLFGPGGLDFDLDGNLYVANNTGDTILKIDPQNNISLFSASPLIKTPGGIAIDGCGNMFIAMYDGNSIVRFRLDTGEAEVFAHDLAFMIRPNDLKLSRGGRLVTTTRLSNLLVIDAQGSITELFKMPQWGDILGVSVPIDWKPCSGEAHEYGVGLAGAGGFVPRMHAIFSPCTGESFGLEWRDFLGGSPAIVEIGVAKATIPAFGASLLVDVTQPHAVVPISFPGSGPGEGDLVLQFSLPTNPSLTGAHLYFQTLATDPAAPAKVSLSNGLEIIVGS